MPAKQTLNIIGAFLERSFSLIKRYIAWEVVFLFYNMINTTAIGLIGLTMNTTNQNEIVLYLIIGSLFWGFMSIIFSEVANSISFERWEGTIEYTFMAPIHRITHLLGICTFAVLYALFRSVLVLIGISLFFDLDLQLSNLVSATIVIILASPAFMGLGIFAAILPLLSPERGAQATHIIQGFILLISGVYYPITVLPYWLQKLSLASPGMYALEAIRSVILKGTSVLDLLPQLIILVLIGLILIPLGLLAFNFAEKSAMRSGTLKRNG